MRDLCRADKRCRGLNPHKRVDKSLTLVVERSAKKDKGKIKLSVGLRLILRPHTDESGSAGKGKKKKAHFISPKQRNGSPSRWKPTPPSGVGPAETE